MGLFSGNGNVTTFLTNAFSTAAGAIVAMPSAVLSGVGGAASSILNAANNVLGTVAGSSALTGILGAATGVPAGLLSGFFGGTTAAPDATAWATTEAGKAGLKQTDLPNASYKANGSKKTFYNWLWDTTPTTNNNNYNFTGIGIIAGVVFLIVGFMKGWFSKKKRK